jgi:hypothetical protein
MKILYSHLNINDFSFSEELNKSQYSFEKIPEYAMTSVEQSAQFGHSYIVTMSDLKGLEPKVDEFYNLCKKNFPSYHKDPFWLLTLLRLYTLFLYVEKNNIEEFLHLEYDNLIYDNPKILRKLPSGIYFTAVGKELASAGIVYCRKQEHFTKFINKLLQLIEKGENFVSKFTNQHHLSEMVLIDLIKTYTSDIDYLPTLPDDNHFSTLQCLFDGASYGQYLGGTNIGHSPGWYGLHHYVGEALHHKKFEVQFNKTPFLIYKGKKIPIFNLHIHCKRLEEFENGE